MRCCSRFDSVAWPLPRHGEADGNDIIVNGKRIHVTAERDPGQAAARGQWASTSCSNAPASSSPSEASQPHLDAGAKRVLISAPATGVDKTVVYGVNHETLTGDHIDRFQRQLHHQLPRAGGQGAERAIGIERGFMTTIHSYTNDQKMLDQIHSDHAPCTRRLRMNMIPTTTGAARAVGVVLPELKGKLDGSLGPRADAECQPGRPDLHAHARHHARKSSTQRSRRHPKAR